MVLHKNFMNVMIKHDSPKLFNAHRGPFVPYNQPPWKDRLVLFLGVLHRERLRRMGIRCQFFSVLFNLTY